MMEPPENFFLSHRPSWPQTLHSGLGVATTCSALLLLGAGLLLSACGGAPDTQSAPNSASTNQPSATSPVVSLSSDQVATLQIEAVKTYPFDVEKEAVGSVSYDKISDPATKDIVANFNEIDSPLLRVGQAARVEITAYPGETFTGTVSALGGTVWDAGGNPAIDPNTHRVIVRCEVADPKNELYPGMFANVSVQVQDPVESTAIPTAGVVRNGDGTLAAWVTTDRRQFSERIVKVGLQRDGQYQVLEGLSPGELAVTKGAVFLSNILEAPPSD